MTKYETAPLAATFASDERLIFGIAGESQSPLVGWFARHLRAALERHGHQHRGIGGAPEDQAAELPETLRLVLNLADIDQPRPVRRSGQGTFVVTIVEGLPGAPEVMKQAYPVLVRSLSNMVIYCTRLGDRVECHFVTIELGHYVIQQGGDTRAFFDQVFERIRPLACSHLVINNAFTPDLPDYLWGGDTATAQICWAGQQLDAMGLLPAAIPIQNYLSERDYRHVKRLYGIGGLSYGNISARALHDPSVFWMSASGVDKSRLQIVGRDILLVRGYDHRQLLIQLSVPPNVEPRRVSVDAIEHFMIYREHPGVGAIVHVHAWWRDPIESTQVNYPCGTYELAAEVAELVRQAPDPTRAVIGLKNHGLTITGQSIREIFARIDGMLLPQVPMS